jgi:thioredoxin
MVVAGCGDFAIMFVPQTHSRRETMIFDLGTASLSEIVKKGDTLIDFWAPWCHPCRAINAELERLAAMKPDLQIVKVNVDEQPAVVREYDIKSVPTLVGIKAGEAPKSTTGVLFAEELIMKFGF